MQYGLNFWFEEVLIYVKYKISEEQMVKNIAVNAVEMSPALALARMAFSGESAYLYAKCRSAGNEESM